MQINFQPITAEAVCWHLETVNQWDSPALFKSNFSSLKHSRLKVFYSIVAMFCKRQVVTGLAVRCDSDTCLQTCSSNVILRKLGFLNLNLRRTKTLPATEKCNEFVQDLNLSPEMEHAPQSPPPGKIREHATGLGGSLQTVLILTFQLEPARARSNRHR